MGKFIYSFINKDDILKVIHEPIGLAPGEGCARPMMRFKEAEA
ncbi:MAG: hypothetical protein RSB35_02155 [Eubacterium sp.]